MKGYSYRHDRPDPDDHLPMWQSLITGAVGDVIEFWGFKRNHGRLWALLYIRNHPMNARQLQEALQLSKGAVSMITRDLEDWNVVQRQRVPDSKAWHFVAEIAFMDMITHVLQQREGQLIARVKTDLDDAYRMAQRQGDVPASTLQRMERMQRLAGLMEQALKIFTRTARLDVSDTRDLL